MTAMSHDALMDLMSVVGDSDSVELKLTVPDSHHRSTGDALDLDPVQAEPRQVIFFDTPDLMLNEAGLVVRARRMPGGEGDTVIKLRPVVPDQISDQPPQTRVRPSRRTQDGCGVVALSRWESHPRAVHQVCPREMFQVAAETRALLHSKFFSEALQADPAL